MMGTVAAVLLLLWTLDRLGGHTLGGLAHLLPVAALGLVVPRFLRRWRAAARP